MEIKKKSFLFFFIRIVLLFSSTYGVHANKLVFQKTDSGAYYYKVIIEAENRNDFQKAISYYLKQYQKNIEEKKTSKAANDLEILATGKYNVGSFNESEQFLISAAKLYAKDTTNNANLARKRIYTRLGIIYRNLKYYDKSLELYKTALKTAKTKSDSLYIINNISNVLREKGSYHQAIDTLKYIVHSTGLLNNNILKALALDNLGYTQLEISDKNSLHNLNESLKIRMLIKDSLGLFSSYRHLSIYHRKIGDKKVASDMAKNAFVIAKKLKDPNYEFEALGLLAELSPDKNLKRFKLLNDSLTLADHEQTNKYATLKYDVEKEKEQTQIAKLQSEKEKQRKTVYLALTLILTLIFSAITALILSNRKKKQLKTIFDTETRISKKLHDELANDTFQVMAQLQTLKEIPKEIIDDLDKIYTKTRDISKDHNPLYKDINFYEQLTTMLASYKRADFNVMVRNDQKIEWDSLKYLRKKTIYIVLKELMTNNRKHSQSNFALITFSQKGKKLNIIYKDDGIGGIFSKSNGLQNVESRIEALNGTLTFDAEPNNGFKVIIQI